MAKGPGNQQIMPYTIVIHPSEITEEAKFIKNNGLGYTIILVAKWLGSLPVIAGTLFTWRVYTKLEV